MILCNKQQKILLFLVVYIYLSTLYAQNSSFPFKNNELDSFSITINPLPHAINSHFSEFSGVLLSDSSFWFTSMRNDADVDREHFFETNWYCYIYNSQLSEKFSYSNPQKLPNKINNPKYFNSNFFISDDGKQLYFARCQRFEDGDLKCSLWKSIKQKNKWQKPQKLPEPINLDNFSTLQPFLVEYNDYKVIYFVSNRPGGYGNLDIWYSIYKDGVFQTPINVGPIINTEGNEVTPYYNSSLETLFFSTDERKGFGDYDIWYSKGALSRWQPPELLSKPFNSEYNDIYFVLNNDNNSGYLSSNRLYYNMIEDTCCNDIYYFNWNKIERDTIKIEKDSTLSKRISSILPITLYFQNDTPDPKSYFDTTVSDYLELYNLYMSDIQQYIRMSGEGLNGEEQREAMYSVSAFMRDSVQTGYDRLMLLVEYLVDAVDKGYSVSLKVQGFASPLHNEQYNKLLSKRRIISLLNFLKKIENEKLKPYLEDKKKGLEIEILPEGAVKHTFETDKIRETVFGLRAAKDRKIVISE